MFSILGKIIDVHFESQIKERKLACYYLKMCYIQYAGVGRPGGWGGTQI